jgi:PAS domain S-box-containing protein
MLQLQRRQSRHILNSIPTVIYDLAITTKGFPTQWISDSVKRILGYEVDDALVPDWWIDCLHPDDKEAAVKKAFILMSQGHLVQEYRFRSKDGRYLWIRDEATLLRDAYGRPKERILEQYHRTQAGGRTGSASEQARHCRGRTD